MIQIDTRQFQAARAQVSLLFEEVGALATHTREAADFGDGGLRPLTLGAVEDAGEVLENIEALTEGIRTSLRQAIKQPALQTPTAAAAS